MWNGLLKFTVMVSVVGVGLFAAYQAQMGMNRSSFFSTNTAVADKAGDPSQDSPATEDSKLMPASSDDSFDLASRGDAEPINRELRPAKKQNNEPKDDFADSPFGDEPTPVKTTPKAKRSVEQMASARQTARTETESQDADGATESPPKQAPIDLNPFGDEMPREPAQKRNRAAARPSNVEPVKDNKTSGDTESNPFEEDTAPKAAATAPAEAPAVAAELPPAKEETQALDAPQEPGRARLFTEVTPDSEIPRSKRAKRNSVKRAEATVDTDTAPTKETRGGVVQASETRDSFSDDTAPALQNNAADGFPDFPPSANPAQPRSLPMDPPADDSSSRPSSRRPRSAPPAVLNLDTDNAAQLRSRDSVKKQAETVTPTDMVGDGEIGDASLKGLQQPRLSIEKITQQQAILEQPLVYTIVVKNTGAVDAHNIVIEDRIPKGTELQGTSPQAEMSGKRLIWNHPLLKPNEEKRISIKVIPKQEGPVGSVARVYFATEVSHEMVVMAPQLDFTVKAPNEIRIGQKFEMVFTLKNNGKVDANNVVVRDLVPESFKHEMGLDIECPVGKVPPGESREVTLTVTATKTGSVINRAIMTADSGVKKTLDSPIDVVGEVLVLTRSGQNRLYVERPVVFTNNIRNDGNQMAERVKISEVVPAGMEFETASDGGRFDASLRAVVWTLGPLAPGNDKSVTVKYVPKETGTVAAKVSAQGNLGSSTAINSTIEVIGKPELQMETLSATGTVTVGDRITSKFQLNNTGTAAANNVQLRVKLPPELKLISVKGANFRQQDDYLLFEPISELAPRKKVAYELVLEPMAEADAQIGLEISAKHLEKPGRRIETIQIARDALK